MAAPEPFVELHLRGVRFDAPGMPVDALTEVVAYRELLVEVAKGIFLRRRPGRQRVSKGFVDRLQLRLRRVESGSSTPVLERVDHERDQALVPVVDEFSMARDLIQGAVASVLAGAGLPPEFPVDAVGYFNRFGRTLRADESIELRVPGALGGPRYNLWVRRSILLSQSSTYRSRITLFGRVAELDAETFTFRLRTLRQGSILCHYEPELFPAVKAVLQPDGAGPLMRIDGVAVLDRSDNIVRVEGVDEISGGEELDAPEMSGRYSDDAGAPASHSRLDLLQRVAEVAAIQDGWLDGGGEAPKPAVVDAGRELAEVLVASVAPAVRLYPTPEGGLQFEWISDENECSIEIGPNREVYYVAVNRATGDIRELEFDTFNLRQVFDLIGGANA